jgi:hypothetical protein
MEILMLQNTKQVTSTFMLLLEMASACTLEIFMSVREEFTPDTCHIDLCSGGDRLGHFAVLTSVREELGWDTAILTSVKEEFWTLCYIDFCSREVRLGHILYWFLWKRNSGPFAILTSVRGEFGWDTCSVDFRLIERSLAWTIVVLTAVREEFVTLRYIDYCSGRIRLGHLLYSLLFGRSSAGTPATLISIWEEFSWDTYCIGFCSRGVRLGHLLFWLLSGRSSTGTMLHCLLFERS